MPWRSAEFPAEETSLERDLRFSQKPGWREGWYGRCKPRFLRTQVDHFFGWPWGYVICRTAYAHTSDEEWAAAISKLDRYIYWAIDKVPSNFPDEPNLDGLIREGYRNVIIDDSELAGAPVAAVRKRYHRWCHYYNMQTDGSHGVVRFDFCIALDDRSVQSILTSAEPEEAGKIGYVNVIDSIFDPDDEENDTGQYYDGCLRVYLDKLFMFALYCEDNTPRELGWGECGLNLPDKVVVTDGYSTEIQDKDMFQISPWSIVRDDLSATTISCHGIPSDLLRSV
ncbi:hypothetical protein N7481_008299 [Penicillium waksmanii]|uniref:uncharacterized protein n=1 Tax=Penicillium waksmanii TaxID=69791 RepID=UPI0025497C15|nr:uncharacterized protein N7481_008299 [Penicillium waksmanii]KAJ5981001.1 hypothetical protein N7481_008299 [Penicillium waksmanii]